MTPAVAEERMTAKEFLAKYGGCTGVELVRGKVVWPGQEEEPARESPSPTTPKLVIEVRSPSDKWSDMMGKAVDHLRAGVTVVVLLDPPTESASVYRWDSRPEVFEKDETLTIPDLMPGFTVQVARFFEE
jgi:Uma2 family endonuclease